MDGSPVVRQRLQNKTIRSDVLRTKSEKNKKTVESKSSKASLLQNLENQDPRCSGQVQKTHIAHQFVSRLPILAKSVHLQTPNEFTQSHNKWEEKPLVGKARSKKPCTRPVPFNFSQPKARKASDNRHSSAIHQTRTSSQMKVKKLKPSEALQENVKSFKSADKTQPLGHLRPSNTTSATMSKLQCSKSSLENCGIAAEKVSATVTCSNKMNLLSLKDTEMDNFQHDHSALLSILRNEGVTSTMAAQTKAYNYQGQPQRVSVMKGRHKAGPSAGSVKSVPFSPDHGALQSILKNEGVKAASERATSIYTPMRVPVKKGVHEKSTGVTGSSMKTVQFSPNKAVMADGATPKNSMCPAGRSTSIYTAQRVPLKKNLTEQSPGQAMAVRKQSFMQTWTPQRVIRHQTMSAMKWHQSQPSPYAITPGLQSCKASLSPKQEEVVQKLFEEDEENPLHATEFPPDQTCKGAMLSTKETRKDGGGWQNLQEQNIQPFIQNPERGSVIFFSTGKKLYRDPHLKKPEEFQQNEQTLEDSLPVLQQSREIRAPVQTGTKDPLTQTDVVNPAVALLRKRLPNLQELMLDEEVATYTSVSVSKVPGCHPPRPHCVNPVSTILQFEESTRFVPVAFDVRES